MQCWPTCTITWFSKVRKNTAEWANLACRGAEPRSNRNPRGPIRYHVCFGSWHVPHVADAPLEEIVDLILKVRAGAYSIEAANVRART